MLSHLVNCYGGHGATAASADLVAAQSQTTSSNGALPPWARAQGPSAPGGTDWPAATSRNNDPYHYSYHLPIQNPGSILPKRFATDNSVFNLLKPRLSDVFPLTGMEDNPKVGDKLELEGSNPVVVTKVTNHSFSLRSLPGHIEGANNVITFSISDNGTYLDVTADGPRAAPFPASLVPHAVWPLFAYKVATAISPFDNPYTPAGAR